MPRTNDQIRAKEVRLVDNEGTMVGIVPLEEAKSKAEEAELDLIEVSPKAEPPVCKILDFGKYRYEAKKRANEAKKKQKVTHLKEIKFRPNIGKNDFENKLKHIVKFVEAGDKVKISLRFRGREIVHDDIGQELFDRIIEATQDKAKLEVKPKMEGKQMMMILAPVSSKK